MSVSPTFRDPVDAASAGYYSVDYAGSLDEWIETVARSMVDRYLDGDQSMLDGMSGATGGIGQPNRADFGSRKPGENGRVSAQTVAFFRNYARTYLDKDEWIRNNFGPPPTRSATYTTTELTRDDKLSEAQKDRENQLAVAKEYAGATIEAARLQADAQVQAAQIRADTDWAIAQMEDLTRRYIAEGEWGLQRELAYMQENGLMTRFMLELGFKEKALAQEAKAERNRHHEAMLGIITELAKYGTQLAAEPRNWIAYAAWLQNRGEVVNALTLQAAAQAVPETSIDPGELVNTPAGQNLAGGIVVQNILIAGQNGMQVNGVSIGTGVQPPGGQQVSGQQYNFNWSGQQGLPQLPGGQQMQTGGQQAQPEANYSWNGINLNNTNYTELANQILGLQGPAPTTQQLQETYESVNPAGSSIDTTGYYSGPKVNALGMQVNPLGHKNAFGKFSKLLPSQQQMNIGAASSVGRPEQDYIAEFTRAMPRGRSRGAAAYG